MTPAGPMAGWRTNDAVIAEQLRVDPEFRAEWERTAVGRVLATTLVRYRAEHGLSQRGLADSLEMPAAQIARLELGEDTPRADIITRISECPTAPRRR